MLRAPVAVAGGGGFRVGRGHRSRSQPHLAPKGGRYGNGPSALSGSWGEGYNAHARVLFHSGHGPGRSVRAG